MATKLEARPKVRFSEIHTDAGVVEVWSDLPLTEEEKAYNTANDINRRVIDYLYFPAVKIGGTGKQAEECVKWTFSEFRDHEASLSNPRMPADIYLSGKDPKVSTFLGDDNEKIRAAFALISSGVKDYEENLKEDGPTVLRNIKNMVTDQLARIFCVLAGTGEIPEADEVDLSEYFNAAHAEAKNILSRNNRDDMGQIRLKAKKS